MLNRPQSFVPPSSFCSPPFPFPPILRQAHFCQTDLAWPPLTSLHLSCCLFSEMNSIIALQLLCVATVWLLARGAPCQSIQSKVSLSLRTDTQRCCVAVPMLLIFNSCTGQSLQGRSFLWHFLLTLKNSWWNLSHFQKNQCYWLKLSETDSLCLSAF